MSYYSEPNSYSKNKIKFGLELTSNHATKSDLKEATGINPTELAKKTVLENVDK